MKYKVVKSPRRGDDEGIVVAVFDTSAEAEELVKQLVETEDTTNYNYAVFPDATI